MTSFPAKGFLLDLIDKAHAVGHKNNFIISFRTDKIYFTIFLWTS